MQFKTIANVDLTNLDQRLFKKLQNGIKNNIICYWRSCDNQMQYFVQSGKETSREVVKCSYILPPKLCYDEGSI